MKKFKFMMIAVAGVFALSTAGVFGYNAYQEATMTAEERLLQANLEALTDGETGEGGIPINGCYFNDDLKTEETPVIWVFKSQSGTNHGIIYDCPSNTSPIRPGGLFSCVARK